MRSIAKLDLQYAHRFYGFKGEAQYLHGHTGVLTLEVEDSVEPGVNMVFPCNEIQKTAWEVLKNFDHALVLREDDPLLPAILDVYEKQGIKNGAPTNKMKGPAFKTELATAYPEIEKSLKLTTANKKILLKTLQAVIGTLDPTLRDVRLSKDLKDTFIIRRNDTEIIIQEGKLLNRDVLSSGTAEGIDVAMFLASMVAREGSFYYCDEHFSYIQSDIEKRIFGIMLNQLSNDDQLIFTTHNTDMLDLNLPKHSYIFLRKQLENNDYKVSAISASDVLKRNTDSLRNAVENDVFSSLPQDSLLDELEMGWANEQ